MDLADSGKTKFSLIVTIDEWTREEVYIKQFWSAIQ